jgi:transposase-like protein
MADKSVRYTPEFKRQMVDLVRAGRTAASLAKESRTLGLDDRPVGQAGGPRSRQR